MRSGSVRDKVVPGILFVGSLLSVLTLLAIVVTLLVEACQFLSGVPWSRFVFDVVWAPRGAEPRFGVWPLLCGTLLTSGVAMTIAIPLGVLSAIFSCEYASPRFRAPLRSTLELLAAVPTVAYGYVALVLVTPFLQRIVPDLAGFNALSPGILIGLMITPTIASLSGAAIERVPTDVRQAAYALGASQLATLRQVILPTAGTAIAGSVVLAMSRAMGETMIVTLAAGSHPRLTLDVRVPIETMTSYIVAAAHDQPGPETVTHGTLFVVGGLLFCITFATQAAARWLMHREAAA